jgi:integrase
VLLEDLKTLKERDSKLHGFNNDYFVAGDAFPISSNALSNRKNKNCELAELPQIRIHDFRHSCASLLINSGANVTVVAKYLGHTKIEETLNTYNHLFSTALNEVVNVIDNLEQ